MKNGKFFVLEGLDGSGKTSVINKLKEEFPYILYTREPGGSVFGESIRKVLLSQESKNVPALPFLLAFMSARASHFEEVIVPALREGRTVVSDRFDASTYAFQLCGQESCDLEDLFWRLREEILQTEEGVLFRPRYIYLRLSLEKAAERRQGRRESLGENTHFDDQAASYHQRVFGGYEDFFQEINSSARKLIAPSEHKVSVIDASVSPNEVYGKVRRLIMDCILKFGSE